MNTIILITILLIKNSVLTEKKETNPKAPNSKFNGRAWVTTYKTFLVKVTLDICPGKFLLLILFSKPIVGHII